VFDLRYHVASLAAVFLALLIGILVGVGISGRGFVDKSERNKLEARIEELQGQLDSAQKQSGDLSRQQQASLAFIKDAYPALMHDRLRGKRVALVFVGSIDGGVRGNVETALTDANARPLLRIRAVKVPIDAKGLDSALAGRATFARYVGDDQLGRLGRALGRELVAGGDTPLWDVLSPQLVEERFGGQKRPADGVVVVRSAAPQQRATARFVQGLYAGLGSGGAPAVGVEASGKKPSTVDAFARNGLSTVDDIDTATGRLALVLLLAGGDPGDYGLKDAANDGILPPIEPLPNG
jgi:hypothetical protein